MKNLCTQPRFLLHSIVLFLWLLIGIAGPSIALPQGNSRDIPVAPFRLTETSGELGIEFNYLGERQGQNGDDSVRLSNRSLEEYILMRLKGYVYHPRFLDFRIQLKMGLLQQVVQQSGLDGEELEDESSNTFLRGYDIYLTFLKEHPLSVSFIANRDRRAVLQLFTDRQLVETENLGAIINWKKDPFPMDFSFNRKNIREWGVDSHSDATNQMFQYTVRHKLGERIRSELRYRLQKYEQTFVARTRLFDLERETDLESHDLSLLNTIYISADKKSYLNSSIRWFELTGTQELENLFWQERLQLQHAPNLRTYYLGSFLRNEVRSSSVDTYRLEAGIEHRLYQSLDSHLDGHWRQTDFDASSEREYGLTGRLNYRKHTRWGYLTAGYGRTLNQIQRMGLSGTIPVFNERITLEEGITQFLANSEVIEESIFVTSTSGLVTYTEGFDYEVEVRGNRTGIRLLPGGQLNDGDTVLVDYETRFISDLEYILDDQTLHIRYDVKKYLDGLSLYYRWHDLAIRDAPSENDYKILEFTNNLYGASYKWRQITLTEEYETYDSNSDSYDQIRSQIEGSHRLNRWLRLGWRAGLLLVDYADDIGPGDDHSKILFAGTTMGGTFRNNGYWQVEGRARKETGRTEETLLGVVGKLGFRWRKMRLALGGRAEQQKRFDNSRDRFHIFLQIAREL